MKIVHLTEPKSGSHWVTDVLSDPEILKFAPGVKFQRCEDHRLEYWSAQPDGFFMGPMFSTTFEEWMRYRTGGDRAIYVLRDPRDCIVSWTFSFSYSHESQPHVELIRPTLLASSLRRRLMLGAYQYWQSSWIVRTWAGRTSTASEHVVTYEAIVAGQAREFAKMFAFLGWNVPQGVVDAVVAYHSFEARTRGRERGKLDTYSHYRRGAARDWCNYFDRDLGRMFERACPHLLVQLGYERSDEWFEELPESVWALSDGEVLDTVPASGEAAKEIARLRADREEIAAELRAAIATVDAIATKAGSSG